jgi:8-oxo-dGTP diphosphatase
MKKGIDYVGVGVGAVVINRKGKYFLTKRGKRARNEVGKWEFPGGGLEYGDTLKDTVIREIKEEFGFEIEPYEQLPACDHRIPNEKQHWIAIAFLSRIKRGKPKILEPEKCDEIGWFTLDEIGKMELSIPTRFHLGNILKRK